MLTWVYIAIGVVILFVLVAPLISIGIKKAIIAQANNLDAGLFVPLPQPGKFSFLMIQGRLERILENVTGWKLIQCPDGEFRYARSNSQRNQAAPVEYQLSNFEQNLGVVWVGWYAKLRKFSDWKWTEYRQKSDPEGNALPGYGIIARNKDAVYEFFFQFTFAIQVTGLEIVGNITVSFKLLLTIWHLDPKHAFLDVKNYDDTFVGFASSAARGWATGKTFDQIKKDTEEATHDSPFAKAMRELNGIKLDLNDGDPDYSSDSTVAGGLFRTLGVVIWDAALQDLTPEGQAAEALKQKEVNRLEGEAAVEKQEKERQRVLVESQTGVDKALLERERVMRETETEVNRQKMLADSRRDFIERTIVQPIKDGGPEVAQVLIAQVMASKDSNITTWVNGSAPIALAPENKK